MSRRSPELPRPIGKMMMRPMIFIPSEISFEILSRLPIRTLARFRAACKPWNRLISDAPFKHHLVREDNPLLLLVRNVKDSGDQNILELSTYNTLGGGDLIAKLWDFPFVAMKPIQSCRGLVCLGGVYMEDHILICHPSSGNLVFLPQLPLSDDIKIEAIGFGYSFNTDEFKVVVFCYRYDYSEEIPNFLVFTLGTSKWRVGGKPPFALCPGVPYLHGALHLLPLDLLEEDGGPGIGVLDIGSESCNKRMIPLPEYFCNQWRTNVYGARKLEVLRGSLYLAFYCKDGKDEVWCLTDYKRGVWSRYYTTCLNYLCTTPFPTPIKVMGDGSVSLHIAGTTELLRYYPTEKEDVMQKDRYHVLYAESVFPLGN